MIKIKKEHCTLEKILEPEEVMFVKSLFAMVSKDSPKGELLATTNRQNYFMNCEHNFSFGYTRYCDNQCYITEYINLNKEIFPKLYERLNKGEK